MKKIQATQGPEVRDDLGDGGGRYRNGIPGVDDHGSTPTSYPTVFEHRQYHLPILTSQDQHAIGCSYPNMEVLYDTMRVVSFVSRQAQRRETSISYNVRIHDCRLNNVRLVG